MQVLHESNLTTELIKGPITHEICRGTRTPLPLFTVTLLNMSVRPSLAPSGAVRKLAVIQARKLRITFSAPELSLFPPHHPTIILLLRLPIQLAFL